MQDDALADLIALAVVFHQAEVLVAAVGGFDGAEEQGRFPTLRIFHRNGLITSRNMGKYTKKCVTTFFQKRETAPAFSMSCGARTPKKRKHALARGRTRRYPPATKGSDGHRG